MHLMTDKRMEKFKRVASLRQRMTVVLENVHDPHNIGAVIRSCDAVGIDELFILYTEDHLDFERLERLSSSSTGVKKWIRLHCYRDIDDCFNHVRMNYDKILATHLGEEARSIYDTDLTANVALLFGNEHEGLSDHALSFADGNIIIPQMGMAQSLNISVACAISIFEASRQRIEKGMYNDEIAEDDEWRMEIKKTLYRHSRSFL